MINTSHHKTQLFEYLQQGAVILTPNNRLALKLQEEYLAFSQKTVLEKPSCLSYQAFLSQLYRTVCHHTPLTQHPFLLSAQQLGHLWHQLLIEHNQGLVNRGLIAEVQESWSRCMFWEIPPQHPAFGQTAQTRLFQQWWFRLEEKLKALEAITDHHLVSWIIEQELSFVPPTLIWLCFDDETPQQQTLKQYLSLRGTKHINVDFLNPSETPKIHGAKDEEAELEQIRHWLKANLAQGKKHMGVIVPDLQQKAKPLQRYLQQHFSKESFNISMGLPLCDYPLIAHALCWLTLFSKPLTPHQTTLLLTSPFLGGSQSEMLARAQFLQDSPVLKEMSINDVFFLHELKKTAPLLTQQLQAITAYPSQASPEDWASMFQKRLSILGFPGEYPLDSPTYQCYQRFLLLLDEFKQLQMLSSEMTLDEALSALANLSKTTVFQPKKKAAAPIQIMGLLEAAGIHFDSLWIMGLTDQCLPQKTRLSAFIPVSLQREKQMPHAHPDRELVLAKKTLARLKNAGGDCVLSYPLMTEDRPNLPSPLLMGLKNYDALIEDVFTPSSPLHSFIEHYQLPLSEQESVAGGTHLLANQAKCPFRAFAAHRLHAKAPIPSSDGPNAMERGQLIHKVMEVLWGLLKDQQTLLSISPQTLDEYLEKAIDKALAPLITTRPQSFPPVIQAVEKQRQKRLALAILDWEKQRPPFQVEALEKPFTVSLSGLVFQLRVDRLDKVDSEKKWVLDYKTTMPQSMPWEEAPPTEPQLLLYALLDESINTLLFAELKNGQFQCKGLTDSTQALAGLKTIAKESSWEEQRQQWQQQLLHLVEAFKNGHCQPQPIKSSICESCDYQNLCRFA